jgi:polyhydroxyalkanoate synthase
MKKTNWEDFLSPLNISGNFLLAKMAVDAAKTADRLREARNILLGPLNTSIAETPYDVVYEQDRVKLKHYKPAKVRIKTPLLITYALVNRETMLDLQPDRSVIRGFLEAGLEVYMIDWGFPTRKDRYLTIDDHVNGYMDHAVEYIRKKHGIPQVNLMGICMGGTFSVIYASLHPEKIKNLVTTVTPVNFDTDENLLNIWSRSIDADGIVEAYGNMPGDLLNLGFLMLNPARLIIDKYVGFLENVHKKDFVENFVRMERWIFDSPDVPGETFRQFINDLYKQNLLVKNRLKIGGRTVDLGRITMPVLNIYARLDHLVPPSSSDKFTGLIPSPDKEDVVLETGHIGIYVSSKTQKEFGPKIIRWLRDRDGEAVPARADAASAVPRKRPRKKAAAPAMAASRARGEK